MPPSLRFGRASKRFGFQLLQSIPSELQIGNGDFGEKANPKISLKEVATVISAQCLLG